MLTRSGPITKPWETLLVTGCQVDLIPTTTRRRLYFSPCIFHLEGKIKWTGNHKNLLPFLLCGCFAYSIKLRATVSETLFLFNFDLLISFSTNHLVYYILLHCCCFSCLVPTPYLFPFPSWPPALIGLWSRGSLHPCVKKPGQIVTDV